jgi:hypothetical protein
MVLLPHVFVTISQLLNAILEFVPALLQFSPFTLQSLSLLSVLGELLFAFFEFLQ